jgi:predicted GNAT family N-acyltransferase
MNDITIHTIDIHHPAYQQVWQLREDVLRKPLGLSLKNEDLSMDAQDTIFTAVHDEQVLGCVMMHPVNKDVIKLRQMAVYPEWQGKGLGAVLVEAAEQYSLQQGYRKIILHARMVAYNFYSKLGYSSIGDRFTEVGIPHVLMEKVLA